MAKNKLNLLADFPAVSTQEWMEKITTDLKGADFDKKLVWRTNEGFNVRPFYRSEDVETLKTINLLPGEFPYVRGTKTNNDWHVRQDIVVVDAAEANKKALDILNKGVTSLGFKLKKSHLNTDDIATLLCNIQPEYVELNFYICVKSTAELLTLLHNYFKSKAYDLTKLYGSVNFDPMNRMLLKGKDLSADEILQLAKNTMEAAKELPYFRVINVNAVSLANAGAHITQELAYALAWGNQYLSMLNEAGLSVADVAKKIKFNFGVGSNYFMEIAKFRAARLLWALIVDKYLNNDKDAYATDRKSTRLNSSH